METSSFKTIRDLLTPHIRNQTQVIHQEHDSASNYANLLNSFESLQDPEEDNFSLGFSNGLASALLLNALTSISIRLKRKSIDQ